MVLLERRPLKDLLVVYVLSVWFSLMVVVRMLLGLMVQGPMKFFHTQKRLDRPDVLDDPSYGKHQYARLKQIKLHYVSKGPEDKPLMLFLHGFPEFWYSWRHQLVEFGKDYRAVALDMRGYGESDKPDGISKYSVDKLINDVKELIEYLGYKKCVLVSHDWGGVVAWAFSYVHPSMVEKLVVCNCPNAPAMTKMLNSSYKQKMKSWYMIFFQAPILPEMMLKFSDFQILDDMFRKPRMGAKPGSINDDDMEALKYTYQDLSARSCPINYYRAVSYFKPTVPRPNENAKILVPTLIIWGTKDAFLNTELAELSGKLVADCRIKFIDGASHWIQQEEPELVNKYIREFVSGQC